MKIKIFNIIILIILSYHFLHLLTNRGYYESLSIGPIFFSDVILVILGTVGPVFIFFHFMGQKFLTPSIFMIISIAFFLLAYFEYPPVKIENLMNNITDVKSSIDDFSESQEFYKSHGAMDHFRLQMEELQLFHSIYDKQYSFLTHSISKNAIGRNRLTIFFGLLGLLSMINSINHYRKIQSNDKIF